MTTQSLTRVTLETLKNYRLAATQAVVASRLGTHRIARAVDRALEGVVGPKAAKLAPRATGRMNAARGKVTAAVVKGIDQVAERTEKAIQRGGASAAAQVHKVADFAAGIDNSMVANGLRTAARLTMPGAKVALAVSGTIAGGASALADAVGGRRLRKAGRETGDGAKRVARRAKTAVTATVRTAAKRVAKVATPAKARRARASTK